MGMREKSVLKRQNVIRKEHQRTSALRPLFHNAARFVTSLSFKISLLVIGMVSVSLLFLYLYQCLTHSSYLSLKEVLITGVDDGIKHELIQMSGLSENLSLLTINPNEIKHKMEKHPWVRSVQLEKRFPHTLAINIEKQSPRAVVAFGGLFYMNKWGKVFKELDKDDNRDYPVITGISKDQKDTDEKLQLAAGILDVFENETGLWSLNDISEIHVNDIDDALVYSVSLPIPVRVGSQGLDGKKHQLKEIVKRLQDDGRIETVRLIDTNYHDGAVVSFKQTSGKLKGEG
jgi:cell division protein FtsQ